jgi:hypothetical protein
MKPLIALLILGSIATSASAAGTDIHEMASERQSAQQQSNSTTDYQAAFTRAGRYFGRGASGFGHW